MSARLGRVTGAIERRAQSLVAVDRNKVKDLRVLLAWSGWRRRRDVELLRRAREELQPSEYHVVPHGQIKAWADGEIPWSDVGMINGLASDE